MALDTENTFNAATLTVNGYDVLASSFSGSNEIDIEENQVNDGTIDPRITVTGSERTVEIELPGQDPELEDACFTPDGAPIKGRVDVTHPGGNGTKSYLGFVPTTYDDEGEAGDTYTTSLEGSYERYLR